MIPQALQPFAILFGAAFTAGVALALGLMLLRRLAAPLYREEEYAFGFVLGAACLSLLVFALCAVHLAYPLVFLLAGAAILALAVRSGAHRSRAERFPALSPGWRWLLLAVFAVYFVLYFFNAMAPEYSPDGSHYHLGMVGRYLRNHGFLRITWHMYASLSHGVEMLFLFAFAFGRHSAAAMVHFAFLLVLPLLLLSYGRRFGFAPAGVCGALFAFVSPIAGVDGISAYNDVAVAATAFTVFYLLQIWDAGRRPALLPAIGLAAGFCYGAKYTAFVAVPYALAIVAWKSWRKRGPLLRPVLVVGLCAAIMILPWMAKNWIVVRNPFSPFLNAVFPNPYVYISFEQEYSHMMRHYGDVQDYRELPLDVTVRGQLAGLYGPLFVLSPLALLALRWPAGRQLLLAAAVFGCTYFTNIGARFLMSAMPFVAMALALVFTRVKGLGPAAVAVHAVLSWPTVIPRYASPYAWRLEKIPIRQALRIESEESFLNFRMPGWAEARLVEDKTPPGSVIFSLTGVPEAYTTREVLVGYHSAFTNLLADIMWTPILPERAAGGVASFRFPAQALRKVRVVQTASGAPDQWSIAEMRVFHGGKELPREPSWHLRARPNPWDVQLAFDNSRATRWKSWQTLFPGMFVEIDFGAGPTLDMVTLEYPRDQYKAQWKLEGETAPGVWKLLSDKPEDSDAAPLPELRRAAALELKARGVGYLLYYDRDFGADDLRRNRDMWGLTVVGETRQARLYRID